MKNNLIQHIFFFICLQSSVYGQYSIKTNLFAPVSRLPSMGITIERSIDSTKSLQFTFANSFTPNILNYPFKNFRTIKMASGFNPYFELTYFFTKRISISAGYGYYQLNKKETLCQNPVLLEGTFIYECSDFTTIDRNVKTQYFKIAPGFKIFEAGKRVTIDLTFRPSFVIVKNDNTVWDDKNVFTTEFKERPPLALLYNNNFFTSDNVFYLIPKIDLNVGYKF